MTTKHFKKVCCNLCHRITALTFTDKPNQPDVVDNQTYCPECAEAIMILTNVFNPDSYTYEINHMGFFDKGNQYSLGFCIKMNLIHLLYDVERGTLDELVYKSDEEIKEIDAKLEKENVN